LGEGHLTEHEKFFEANRDLWDKFAKINYESKTYKTKEFLKGETSLNSIELEEHHQTWSADGVPA
jgi:hypothetical protein